MCDGNGCWLNKKLRSKMRVYGTSGSIQTVPRSKNYYSKKNEENSIAQLIHFSKKRFDDVVKGDKLQSRTPVYFHTCHEWEYDGLTKIVLFTNKNALIQKLELSAKMNNNSKINNLKNLPSMKANLPHANILCKTCSLGLDDYVCSQVILPSLNARVIDVTSEDDTKVLICKEIQNRKRKHETVS